MILRLDSRRPTSAVRHRISALPALLALVLTLAAVPPSEAIEREDLVPVYRAILSQLAAGDAEGALSELARLEWRVLGERPDPRTVERFWRLKLGVVRDLLTSDPIDVLVPIVVFHHQAYGRYRDEGQPALASHARTMAAELAEYYARRAGTPASAEFAGWVLTSFGSYLQENRSVPLSVQMFRRALEVAPGNAVALLGIAVAHEKYGEYEPALETLRRALKTDPNNAQVRLRLAVCLHRLGQTRTARAYFRDLAGGEAEDWIRSVAYQELARNHLEEGDRQRAEESLRQALVDLPGEQEPAVLLAALLTLEGRHREARQLVAEIGPSASERPSARFLYDSWSKEGVEEARLEMVRRMEDGIGLLAGALARTPAAEELAAEEAG